MASLRDEIQADLVEAFNEDLGDIPVPITYTAIGVGENHTLKAVKAGASGRLYDDIPVMERDAMFIFPTSFLPIEPEINDEVTEGAMIYRIIATKVDPAKGAYVLHARPNREVI
jgi:hypothetical protein